MNHDLIYPVRNCHFCDYIMLYTRYDNGDQWAYCNNPRNSGCMGFRYKVIDNQLIAKEFGLNIRDFNFELKADGTNWVCVPDQYGNAKILNDLFKVEPVAILHKESALQLVNKIRCHTMTC